MTSSFERRSALRELLSRGGDLLGELADLFGDDGEPASLLPRARGHRHCVEVTL